MNDIPPGTILYHIGCGKALYRFRPDQTIALACWCGAYAPILTIDLQDHLGITTGLPVSLVNLPQDPAERNKVAPHLEYYLGFSDYTCPAKETWKAVLLQLGCSTMQECSEAECQARFLQEHARVAQKIAQRGYR